MGGFTVEVTDQSVGSMLRESSTPVLLDFWASWCAPCSRMGAVLEQFAKEFAGRIVVGKVDVDANPGTVAEYGVMGIPAFVLVVTGKPVARLVGPMTITEFREKVLSFLPGLATNAVPAPG